LLPGEAYAVYDRFDVMGEYPEVLQSVLREAGRIVGVGERELGVLVGRLEERLLRGREKERLAGQDKGKGKATSGGDDRGRSGASSGGLSKVKGKEKEVDAGVEDEAHGMEMMNEVEWSRFEHTIDENEEEHGIAEPRRRAQDRGNARERGKKEEERKEP
jgi:hypothetical protein